MPEAWVLRRPLTACSGVRSVLCVNLPKPCVQVFNLPSSPFCVRFHKPYRIRPVVVVRFHKLWFIGVFRIVLFVDCVDHGFGELPFNEIRRAGELSGLDTAAIIVKTSPPSVSMDIVLKSPFLYIYTSLIVFPSRVFIVS